MKEKKPSDKQVMDLVKAFEKMSEDEKKSIALSEGGDKKVYDIHPDFVLKESTATNDKRATKKFAEDYLYLKQLKKEGIPTETPILINRPGQRPLQLQRKLDTKGSKKEVSDAIDTLNDLEWKKGISGTDLGAQNIGFDKDRNPKMLDTYAFSSKDQAKRNQLRVAREAIGDRLVNAKTAKIFRQAAGAIPYAGAAYAAMSGDPAQAAEQAAGDLPFVGQAYEAIKPEDAGSAMDDATMKKEAEAWKNYQNSGAAMDKSRPSRGPAGQREVMSDPTQANRDLIKKGFRAILPDNSPLARSMDAPDPIQEEGFNTPILKAEADREIATEEVPAFSDPSQAPAVPVVQTPEIKSPDGLMLEANVLGKLGSEQSGIYGNLEKQISDVNTDISKTEKEVTDYATRFDAEEKERQDQLDNFKVEPHSFFSGKSTWQKVVGGIGMFLGSLTPEGARNVASIIDNELERDIKNQQMQLSLMKDKQGSAQNAFARKMAMFKDVKMAKLSLKQDMLSAADLQLKKIEAASKGELARAKATQAREVLNEDKLKNRMAFQAQAMKLAQEQSKGIIPGLDGINSNPAIVKDLVERKTAKESAENQITNIEKLLQEGSRNPFGQNSSLAEQSRKSLAADLAKAMFGRSSDAELEIAMQLIPDITSFTRRDSTAKSMLQSLKKKLNSDFGAAARSAGYSYALPTGARKK